MMFKNAWMPSRWKTDRLCMKQWKNYGKMVILKDMNKLSIVVKKKKGLQMLNIFNILNDIIRDKTGKLSSEPEFDKEFNIFMLARYLSMRRDLEVYADFLNKYGSVLSKENLYYYLLKNVPRSDQVFIKYISKPKKKKKDETDDNSE